MRRPENGRIGVVAASGPRISVQFGGVRRASSPGPACGKTEGSVRLPRSAASCSRMGPSGSCGGPEKGCSKPPCADNGARSAVRFGGLSRVSSPSPGPACGKMGALAFLSSSCASWSRSGVPRGGGLGGGGLGGGCGLEAACASTSGGAPPRSLRRRTALASRKLPRRLTTPAPRRACTVFPVCA